MKLHLDKSAFQTLLLAQAERSGIRADIIEKDYYVTLILMELAEKQAYLPAYFKGGTALYKAIGSIRRFSEDIDLTVGIEDGLSNAQKKKRLEAATKKYTSLSRNRDAGGTVEFPGSTTTTYTYDSVVEVDVNDSLQRFETVKIEATSFTVSEPHELMMISPLILDIATEVEKDVLSKLFYVNPFSIDTIKLERIFIDKIFAAEFYYTLGKYFDTAKHLYDIVVLLPNTKIQKLLNDSKMLDYLIEIKRKEESTRRDSDLSEKSIFNFTYFYTAMENDALLNAYTSMQNTYIFDDKYRIHDQELFDGISKIHEKFHD